MDLIGACARRYGGAVDMGVLVYLGKWRAQQTRTLEVPIKRLELINIVQVSRACGE
jgi:hypothetical protein